MLKLEMLGCASRVMMVLLNNVIVILKMVMFLKLLKL